MRKAIRRDVIAQQALKNGNDMLTAIGLGTGFFVAVAIWHVPLVELVAVGVLLKRTSNGITKIQQLFQQAVAVESPYLGVSASSPNSAGALERDRGRRPATLERDCCLEDISCSYADQRILHSVSIEIPAGSSRS